MKSIAFYLVQLALLAALVSCGKDNESGKSGSNYSNPYYSNQYGSINSPYSYGSYSVNQIFQQHPCITTGTPSQARVQVQIPIQTVPMVVAPNDIYVGITSFGDVGVLVGKPNGQAIFVGYICQRGYTYSQGASINLVDLDYGSKSICAFKPLTRATIMLQGSPEPLFFGYMDDNGRGAGPITSVGGRFTFCR